MGKVLLTFAQGWVDSHCHLDYLQDDSDFAALVARAKAADIRHIIIPAVGRFNWARIAKLCEHQGYYPAYGLHPIAQDRHRPSHIDALERFIVQHHGIAIGECGLDYDIPADRNIQIDYFRAQLDLATRLNLPVIVHVRKSLDAVLYHLRAFPQVRFVVHSFTGSDQQLEQLLSQGGYIGVGGTCTYPRAKRLRRQLANIDAGRYLLETDAPYQPINGYQGQRNEPAKIVEVAKVLASLRQQTLADIKWQNWQNNQTFFGL